MVEYDIETRKFNNGDIKTKYNIDGTPTKLTDIRPRYKKMLQNVSKIHQDLIKQGNLEKVITIFTE